MKTLLLAGYQNELSSTALIDFNQQLWVDWQIQQLLQLGHEVGVVIGDKHAEEILERSQWMKKCDLIYDTNESATTLMTNLRSGLYSVRKMAFILPITTPAPPLPVWHKIADHYYRINVDKFDILRSFCPIQGVMQPGFPIAITRAGMMKFKSMKDIQSVEDDRLSVSPVPLLTSDILRQFDHQAEASGKQPGAFHDN